MNQTTGARASTTRVSLLTNPRAVLVMVVIVGGQCRVVIQGKAAETTPTWRFI